MENQNINAAASNQTPPPVSPNPNPLSKSRVIILAVGFGVLILILIVGVVILRRSVSNKVTPIIPVASPSPISSTPAGVSFSVTDVSPKPNQTDVSPGEIQITFTTDKPLESSSSAKLSFNPSIPGYIKIVNNFPSNKMVAQVFGGLAQSTNYKVTISDGNNNPVYTWSFTTNNQQSQSSSALHYDQEQQYLNTYYPLANFVPYSTSDFNVNYTAKLTLTVTVKNPDLNKVKQEVNSWITSHGVDPSTHTINFVNAQ